jgi:leader peptidase (prepilin peptidase)/N-methyltransferase
MRAAFPGIDTPGRIATTCALGVGIDAAMVWRFGLSAALPAYCYFGAVAAIVTVTDVAVHKIPEAVVLPSYPLAAALLAAASRGQWWALARGGIAMTLLGGFYLALGLTFPRQFGSGDIELGALLGLYLGWLGWATLTTGTILAWLLAALALPLRRVATPRRCGPLAAGPFLATGALVAVLLSARPT